MDNNPPRLANIQRCKLCGEIEASIPLHIDWYAEQDFFREATEYNNSGFHRCKDGKIGVNELIGAIPITHKDYKELAKENEG